MANVVVGAKASRDIPVAAGTITPTLVEQLKGVLHEELVEDLMSLVDAFDLIKWEVDVEKRKLYARIELEIGHDDER